MVRRSQECLVCTTHDTGAHPPFQSPGAEGCIFTAFGDDGMCWCQRGPGQCPSPLGAGFSCLNQEVNSFKLVHFHQIEVKCLPLLSGKCKGGVLAIICTRIRKLLQVYCSWDVGFTGDEGFFPASVDFRRVQLLSLQKQRQFHSFLPLRVRFLLR